MSGTFLHFDYNSKSICPNVFNISIIGVFEITISQKDELMKNSLLEKDKDIYRQKECSKVLEKRIVRHASEYQELLNVKTQLEQEIAAYKNLLGQVEKKARLVLTFPRSAKDISWTSFVAF